MDQEIVIVSGLPRSGTSLMMQMLDRGGMEVVTDNIRSADTDNPRGYYEFERAKKIQYDTAWLPHARGKVVKMVSQLLYDLPASEKYRIIFMDRDLDEMLASQEKMLERLNRQAAPRQEMRHHYKIHLEKLHAWLARQPYLRVLRVNYNELMQEPTEAIRRVSAFLDGRVDGEKMAQAVDPTLYRNRRAAGEAS